MPNWCYTTYIVKGDKEQLDKFHSILTELQKMETPRVENGFGSNWLGCLVDYLGEDWHSIPCRGSFTWVDKIVKDEIDEEHLSLTTETAWAPCHEVFELVKKKFPSLSFIYFSEEDGMEFYSTNDVDGIYFPWRWHIDVDNSTDYLREDVETLQEVKDLLEGFLPKGTEMETTKESIQNVLKEYASENEEFYYSFAEIKEDKDSRLR